MWPCVPYQPVPFSTISSNSVSSCWQKRGLKNTSTLQEVKGGSTPLQGSTNIYTEHYRLLSTNTSTDILSNYEDVVALLHCTSGSLCSCWLCTIVQGASRWVLLLRSRVVCVCSPNLMSPKSTLGTFKVTIGPYENQMRSMKRSQLTEQLRSITFSKKQLLNLWF